MRALLIDDDEFLVRKVEATLTSQNDVCHRTDSGEDGLQMAKLYEYDIFVIAESLPDVPGSTVLRHMREAKVDTPVLFLSQADEPEIKIEILLRGADDYMTKPLHIGELLARMQAIHRRSRGYGDSKLQIGPLTLDTAMEVATINGAPVSLRRKEYHFLELLALRKGHIVTKNTFLDQLYDGHDEPCPKIIDVHICNLRKKLAAAGAGEDLIQTIWGRGYTLSEGDAQDTNVVEIRKAA